MGADSNNPFGQAQADQNKSHAHPVYVKDTGHIHNIDNIASGFGGSGIYSAYPSGGYNLLTPSIRSDHANIVVNDDGSDTPKNTTAASGGNEARPKNVRMNWIIKY